MALSTGLTPIDVPPAGQTPERTGIRWRSFRHELVWVAIAVAVLAAGVAAGATGFRLLIVESPSMGRAAPVGTLILIAPARVADVRIGEIVTAKASGGASTRTHRVVARGSAGLTTRGDTNGAPDPAAVTDRSLVGRAVAVLPGLGWLVRALPLLGLGAALIWAITLPVRSVTARAGLRVLGASTVVAGTSLLLRPLVGFQVVTLAGDDHGFAAEVVGTGLLPVRLVASGGDSVVLDPGRMGRLDLALDHAGRVQIAPELALEPLGWIALGLIVLLPAAWVLVVGLPVPGVRPAVPAS